MSEIPKLVYHYFGAQKGGEHWMPGIIPKLSDAGSTVALTIFCIITVSKAFKGSKGKLAPDELSTVIALTLLTASYVLTTVYHDIIIALGTFDIFKTDFYLSYVLVDFITLSVTLALHCLFRVQYSLMSRLASFIMLIGSSAHLLIYAASYIAHEFDINPIITAAINSLYILTIHLATWGILAIMLAPEKAASLLNKSKTVITQIKDKLFVPNTEQNVTTKL